MLSASTPATVIHVGSPLTSSSTASSSSAASPPLASRLRGREPSDGDDDAPFLGSPTSPPTVHGGRHGARATISSRIGHCLSRATRARTITSLFAMRSLSGSATWLAKALFVCLGLLFLGGVGSFTLHQLMSPQIESLLQQRNAMRVDMDALRNQVANQTRIAESRLKMIHMLEQQLEKQVLLAAETAAAAATVASPAMGGGGGGAELAARPRPFAATGPQANFWTTLVYATLLGSLVLAVVAVRVCQIARIETQRTQKARASSDMDIGRVALTLLHDDEVDNALSGGIGTRPSASSSSSSSSAYKRAPVGMTPQDRLVHV